MKNNNKIYTILLVFALIFLFLVIFFIWPLIGEIEKNSEDLISAKNNIVNLDAQINETNNFKKNYETYKSTLERIDQLFVDINNPVNFIEFLENAASNYNVTSKISLPPSSQSSQQFITFQFISKGGFSDILNFVKGIEAGPYLIEIENLTIQDSRQNLDHKDIPQDYYSRNVDATFTIKAFIKPR
ncbi:MAG: hypothetical protein NT094_04340 [Candidatus Staskawiczbacteria bacterium]|nr:hypothetical protein [Candidatus Staskawiczbacteria bacterium]